MRLVGDLVVVMMVASMLSSFEAKRLPHKNTAGQHKNAAGQPSRAVVHIAIMATWNDFNNRYRIRNSWLQFSGNYSYSFIVGKPATDNERKMNDKLHHEILKYKDIITGDFVDSYYNLTRKAVVMLDQRGKAEYIFKADTDTYVNVPQLLQFLQAQTRRESPVKYAGRVASPMRPDRDEKGRWYMPRSSWPDDNKPFPPFAQGQGYLIESGLAECMMSRVRRNWTESALAFPLEDVFVGLLAESCGVVPRHLVSLAQVQKQKRSRVGGQEGVGTELSHKSWIFAHRKTETDILMKLLE